MDFFATGGFQQLLSDLQYVDEAPLSSGTSDYNNNPVHNFNHEEYATFAEPNDPYNDYDYIMTAEEYATPLDDCCYEELHNDVELLQQITHSDDNNSSNSSSSGSAADCNNNGADDHLPDDAQLQQSLDLLLSSGHGEGVVEGSNNIGIDTLLDLDIAATLSDAGHVTRDMSDWEDKFLDNYIEIPELVDILPEKTPLCNEMCELFLQESSKQLKLSRKTHRTPRSRQRQRTPPSAETSETENTHVLIGPANGYPCTFGSCQNVYAKPAHLKAHLRRHLGEKPYICNWPDCTWKFSRSDELARHRRSHSGVKPYKCVYCSKCFARSDHLTKHRKVHERRMLAASREGLRGADGVLPASVFTVRPGRKKKNQC